MLVFLGVLELRGDGSGNIIIFVVDWQFDLLLPDADFVEFLVFLLVEFDVEFNCARKTTEERRQLFLSSPFFTIVDICRFINEIIDRPSYHANKFQQS